jgi:hypothetical protein
MAGENLGGHGIGNDAEIVHGNIAPSAMYRLHRDGSMGQA